ncbi:MAG: transporter substrate-binding domain-containing protein [Desulfovibrio sp.]|jgi:cytidine deaminase|nr:transporter substrate-binding domain-containing protein [Desulfovibrio sp.]
MSARVPPPKASLLLILCLAVLAWTPRAPARAAPPEGQFRVIYGFDREFPPFTFEEAGGEPTGFEVELLRAVFTGSGANLVFRPLQWDLIPLELSSGTITITSGMVRTEQRAKLYLFSEKPTFPLQIRLFTKVYNRFPSAALLRGQPVAVEQGTYQHRLLEAFGGINVKPFKGRADGLRALYNDETAAFCGPVQNAYYYINKLNYGAITTVGTPLGITEMRVAINRERGDVKKIVDKGLAEVTANGEYDRLYRKWFVRDLTSGEQAALRQAARDAAVPAYAPYGGEGRGAAILTATGKIYSACTVENADLNLSVSALTGAVSRAVSEGEFEFRAAVVTRPEGGIVPPSPPELQLLHEFGRGTLVLLEPSPGTLTMNMLPELLPDPVTRDTPSLRLE